MASLQKVGLHYLEEKDKIESFDLILFDGKDIFSHLIKVMEERQINRDFPDTEDDLFSHVGIALRRDALPDIIKDDDVYIWESTMSGLLGEGVKNVDGKSFFGVQLRNFSQVIAKYDRSGKTRVAYAKLINRPTPESIATFPELFKSINGTRYELNPYEGLAAFVPFFRKYRSEVDKLCRTSGWLFCSELVTHVYKYLGLVSVNIDERDIVPQDFVSDRTFQNKLNVVGPPIVITCYPIPQPTTITTTNVTVHIKQ